MLNNLSCHSIIPKIPPQALFMEQKYPPHVILNEVKDPGVITTIARKISHSVRNDRIEVIL